MLDADIRPLMEKSLTGLARRMAGRGFSANMITAIGAGFALPAFVALMLHAYPAALVFILVNRFCDGLDGVIARHQPGGPTDFGGFIDIVGDYLFFTGAIFFFALGRPDDALAAGFLLFSFMGSSATFLAYAAIAEKRGVTSELRGKKSFLHIGGLTEGLETILMFITLCLMPDSFATIALIFGAFCWVTTAGRVLRARADFRPVKDRKPAAA